MLEQMRLRPESGDGPSIYLDVEIPDRLAEKLRALTPGQRLALALRLPATIETDVNLLAHLGELTNLELVQRFDATRRALDALAAERARRGQCSECGVHRSNGHLFGCTKAGGTAR